ncbi:MBL fold metallo-hydrolase [Rubrobacter aplysinae]|uniref:MBL fold metallo-hydrolase n=1 Tax=Rubrobacter aplysinae TaxID=909625 RepID=UPI00069EB0CA|nr:MBL fold metallo-hydrolase [Rubrobacter aplysinae]
MDLNFLGSEEIIGSFLLTGEESAALIETGPTTCLEALEEGLAERGVAREDVRQVFLTHVHLDHAGAAGHLAERLPNATFYVHEIGYPHLLDPSKLLKSATRIYGEDMDKLWGEMRPVPEDRLVSLSDGAEIRTAGTTITAHDTPGHAYHHFAYMEDSTGSLFTGDVAGIRLPGQSYVRPPTPPPEIDVEAWMRSIQRVRELDPARTFLTHFGDYDDVERHLGELEQRLQEWMLFVESRLDDGQSREEITDELATKGDAELLAEGGNPDDPDRYELAGNYEMLVAGLARYVEKRQQQE